MDPSGTADHDGRSARPDTTGVGWPVDPGWDRVPSASMRDTLVLVGLVLWVPISLAVAFLGAVAIGGWQSEGDTSVAGLLDEPALDTALVVFGVAALFVAVASVFARARRSIAFGVVAAVWAPATAAVLLALTT